MEAGEGNIKVVVRCRPLNSRGKRYFHFRLNIEIGRGAKELVRMQGNMTFLDPPDNSTDQAKISKAIERKTMAFSFDKSYWSAGSRDDPDYCSQRTLYEDLGKELLDHGFAGFNACILAYGQTGSGKSYSMMGYGPDKGIIPQTCMELFDRANDKMAADPNVKFVVEVSYIEIYNEKVRDLLNPKNKGNLKVREHPSLGPYVEDLSKLVVSSYDDMMNLMDEGNKARTVAATNMNETSSRSHAVFTLLLTQRRHDAGTNLDTEKVSRISLVDLAGSERARSTGATGQQLKEGANINKSLTTLGKVISALALQSQSDSKPAKGKKAPPAEHIPYRDSVLTWLLKDSIGGNSKTAMIAAISPADYDETLSTLRYADQAKKIKNKAVVNEDPNAKLVRELKEELEMLRARVASSSGEDTFDPKIPAAMQKVTYQAKDGSVKTVTKAELQDQLESSEKLMQSLNETWEEKMQKTQEVHKEREKALEELGITVEKNNVGVHTPKKMPHLVNLNEDPLMSECLIYQLKEGRTMVGRMDSDKPAAIRLSGNNILEEHCWFEHTGTRVTLTAAPDSITLLNGKQIPPNQPARLRSGFRIILGHNHVFRFNNPEEVRKIRDRTKSSLAISISAADLAAGDAAETSTRPGSPGDGGVEDADWVYAQREAALARLHGLDPGLESLPDDDLDKLFDRITKLKSRRGRDSIRRPDSSLGFRPESSLGIAESAMSLTDDVWSDVPGHSPLPTDQTDDTSVDTNSPDLENLESAKQEFESRLNAIEESEQEEELRAEKEHMEQQLRMVQDQMKRLVQLRSKGVMEEQFEAIEPTIYTAKELRLIRKVLDKWRAHRSFSMAETILSGAVLVKEANIASKVLRKNVSYNFTVAAGGSLAFPASAMDTIAGLEDFGDVVDATPTLNTRPSVAIKVLDKQHAAIYMWSLDRLNQQLQRMRNLTSFIDRPSYAQHFSGSEPFYDSPPPTYSFIGNSLVSLAPLARRISSTSTLPIFCRYTAEAIGSCRVDIKVVNSTLAITSPRGSAPSTRASSPMPSASKGTTAAKLNFFVTIDQVKGLSSLDFSSLHCQIRLSSFTGPKPPTPQGGATSKPTSEEVYVSSQVDTDKQTLSELKLRKTFSVTVTSKIAAYLREGYAPIEFFAVLKPMYLERLERWDEMRELRMPPMRSPDLLEVPQLPPMRRSENDFVVEQVHDAIAWLQVTELGADGAYSPVPVVSLSPLDPGAFCLHQGLQRRLTISLLSNSGRQLPWVSVNRVRVGNVRLLDAKGRVHEPESKDMMELKLLKQQSVEFKPDGTGSLSVEALWDSGVHDTLLLNRVTPAGHRVLLSVTWLVEVETCAEPVPFSMDMAVSIVTRDARQPNNFLGFLSSTKVLTKTSTVFSVKLTPPLTRSARDLWRLDTSEKYVRGEDVLTGWKPRGISTVEDYNRLETQARRSADVQAIKAILVTMSPGAPQSKLKDVDEETLVSKSLELWKKKMGHSGKIVLSQDPEPVPSSASSVSSMSTRTTKVEPPTEPIKLVGQAKIMRRSDTAIKKGHLMILVDAGQGTWERRWAVLRRPHLYLYAHSNELEEVGVISLSGVGVKVDYDPHMEALFAKKHTFQLFTASNSYAISVQNAKDLQSWISKLDPTRV